MKLVSCVWEERAVVEIVRVLLHLGAPHSDKVRKSGRDLLHLRSPHSDKVS